MRYEDRDSLRFALTRSIRLRDIVAFRDFLRDNGHTVSLLKRAQGGIDFSYKQRGGKDIRWGKFENIGADADGFGFVKSLSTIARKYEEGMPVWHPGNSIGIRLKELGDNLFSEKEKCDIRRGMVSCLGVTDNVIYNRDENRFKVLRSDGARDVDLFLEYDREKEVTTCTWTVPCPYYQRCTSDGHTEKKDGLIRHQTSETPRPSRFGGLEPQKPFLVKILGFQYCILNDRDPATRWCSVG